MSKILCFPYVSEVLYILKQYCLRKTKVYIQILPFCFNKNKFYMVITMRKRLTGGYYYEKKANQRF